jgi:hypothetical protein
MCILEKLLVGFGRRAAASGMLMAIAIYA